MGGYFVCDNCGCKFDEPEYEHTSYESYYGVSSMFPNSNSLTLEVCPCCGSEDIVFEYDDDNEEDEEVE